MINLKTDRLLLRPFQESDLYAFSEYRSDPEVARYQSWSPPFSLDQAKSFLEQINRAELGTPGYWYQFAIERRNQPGLIGDCGFQIWKDDEKQAHIGFSFARKFQRKGYASEAVHSVLNFLFSELHLHRVIAICDVENLASARLLERVGMRREAHLIENIWFKGSWGSEYNYAILEREWKPD